MLNCKQSSRLMSRSMDEKLPLVKRLSLKMHLFMCEGCTNFYSHIRLLRRAARSIGKGQHGNELRLSDEAHQRIHRALQDAQVRKNSKEDPS